MGACRDRLRNPAAYLWPAYSENQQAVRWAPGSRECEENDGERMATQVAARKYDCGGETERRINGLRRAGKTAGLSRVRRAVPSRSHEGHSVGRSGEARSQGAYSQPVHPVKQRENSKTTPQSFMALLLLPVVYARSLPPRPAPTTPPMGTPLRQSCPRSVGRRHRGGHRGSPAPG